MVFLWEKWLRNKDYGTALLQIFGSYCIIFLIVTLFSSTYSISHQIDLPISNPKVWYHSFSRMLDLALIQVFIYWLIVVIATLIVLQINDKYGPGIFKSFLLGKYFKPIREERIFMFLDLRSSTSIAEKLGETRYFNFIKQTFQDITPAILKNKGEIYQYVGDEVVISWRMEKGIENINCINCFFDVQQSLHEKKAFYIDNYEGIIPEFKAGLHYGHVMTGEIGVVKRDIAFSGDVLNTTARIQAKCNELNVNILFSQYLLDRLNIGSDRIRPKNMGDMTLRGKKERLILYTV